MKKILVIEDSVVMREGLLAILEQAGFEVIGAVDGYTGLNLAQEQSPDLIICDVVMPELDGYEVLSMLRQNLRTASIPFVFLTGKTDKDDWRHGMNLGADDYLTKPFTIKDLLDMVEVRLSKSEGIAQYYNAELKQAEERLNFASRHDALTELPNRLSLQEWFYRALSELPDNKPYIGILCLGLDRVKRVNDSLGYSSGDTLLNMVASRLRSTLAKEVLLARLQSDQFAVLLPSVCRVRDVIEVAQVILSTLNQPFNLYDHEIFISGSIGIALYPEDGRDVNSLIKNAEAAMHSVKNQGGQGVQLYTPEMNALSLERLDLEADLRRALERDELEVYYQPQVSSVTSQIVGAEALVRWRHPQRGLLLPGLFIPLAEETGLITALSHFVLRNVCQQIRSWQKADLPIRRVAVNLSSRQLSQPGLCNEIVQILTETGVQPYYLEIEFTETSLIQNAKVATETLGKLRRLGISVSVDDFGTGYSSLGYLKQFPFDTLKVDQSFVRNVTASSENAAIVTAIIQMAHSLRLRVVAEGVETEQELAFLREVGCDEFQGYLFSRPISAREFAQMLNSAKSLAV